MFVIEARNVNDAYHKGLNFLLEHGERQSSRAGDVLVSPVPVTTVYSHPRERVLFDVARDANPFFHLFEALWMLAGRNDAKWLDLFVKDFSARFAEDTGRQHGAYGWRWRLHFGDDQLKEIITLLRDNPQDRRVVLTMWDPTVDLAVYKKDIPCNTHAYIRIRSDKMDRKKEESVLDLTVCCRSNDAIWGAYGANAVHFSVLQEYLAAMLGVGVGRYYQISNNFHVYTEVLQKINDNRDTSRIDQLSNPYALLGISPAPMVTNPWVFDRELKIFMDWADDWLPQARCPQLVILPKVSNAWLANVTPLYRAALLWRRNENNDRMTALEHLEQPGIPKDWQLAATRWMRRRLAKAEASHVGP